MIDRNASYDPLAKSSALTRRLIVSDEEYASNQARLSQLQALLNSWVATNEQGHTEYLRMHDEMAELVEAGEEAKKVLAGLRDMSSNSNPIVVGHLPSAATLQHFPEHGSGSASITELPSFSHSSRQVGAQPASQASFSARSQQPDKPWLNYTPNEFSNNANQQLLRQHPRPLKQDQPLRKQFQQQQQLQRRRQQQQQQQQQQHNFTLSSHYRPHAYPSQTLTQQNGRSLVEPAIPYSSTSSLDGALGYADPQRANGGNNGHHTQIKQGAVQRTTEKVTPTSPDSNPKTVRETQGNPAPDSATVIPNAITLSNAAEPSMIANVTVPPLSSAIPGSQPVAGTSHLQSTMQSFATSTTKLSAVMSASIVAADSPSSKSGHHDVAGRGLLPDTLYRPIRPDIPAPSTNISKQQAATFIDSWSRSVQPNSYLKVPNTDYFFYKDSTGRVHVLATEGGTTIPRGIPPSATTNNHFYIHKDNYGNYYYSNHPPTPAHLQSNRSYAVPPQHAQFNVNSSTPAISIPSVPMQPIYYTPMAVQSQPVMEMPTSSYPAWPIPGHSRTPAQADKTRLAKDILRSLGPSVRKGRGKRPYDETQAESTGEGGLKRQHLETENDVLPADPALRTLDATIASTPTPVRTLEVGSPPAGQLDPRDPQHLGGSHQPVQAGNAPVAISEGKNHGSSLPQPSPTPSLSDHTFLADETVPHTSVAFTPPHSIANDTSLPSQVQHQALLPNQSSNLNPASCSSGRNMTPPSNIATLSGEVIEISDDDGENEPTKSLERYPTPPLNQSSPAIYEDSSARPPSREPLFLPSPTSSPSRLSIVAGADIEDANDHVMFVDEPLLPGSSDEVCADEVDSVSGRYNSEGKVEASFDSFQSRRKRQQFYILVPPLPDWARQRRKNRAGREQRQRNKHGTEVAVRGETRLEDFGPTMEETRPTDPAEAKVLEQTYLGLRERQCKWRACDAVLNSTESLCKHVVRHIEVGKSSGFNCLWAQCPRRFSDISIFERHLKNHAKSPILCGFIDCDESFRRPRDLVRHNDNQHKQNQHGNAPLRPVVTPFKPQVPSSLGRVPRMLPAHLIEPRYVRNPGVSIDRHILLGEWVLRNILGPIDVGSKRLSAVPTSGYYEYDFLASKSRSPTKLPHLDDLQSAAVSLLIHDGIVFWGSEDSQDDDWDFVATKVECDSIPNQEDLELHGSDGAMADVAPSKLQDNVEHPEPEAVLADSAQEMLQENVEGDALELHGLETTFAIAAPRIFEGEDVRSLSVTTEEEVVEKMLSI